MEPVVQKEILLLQRSRCTFPAFLICIEKFGLSKEKSKYTSVPGGHRQSQPFPVRDQNPVRVLAVVSFPHACLWGLSVSPIMIAAISAAAKPIRRIICLLGFSFHCFLSFFFFLFSFFNLPLRNIVHLTSTHYYPPAVCCCLCWRGCLKK